MKRNAGFGFILGLLLAGVAFAEQSPDPAGGRMEQASEKIKEQQTELTDQSFVEKAAKANMAEIDLSKLAQSKSSDQQVRAYADQIIKDHTQAGDELRKIAGSKKLMVPAAPADKEKQMVDKLQKKSGADFDHAYLKVMEKMHGRAIAMFTNASKSTTLDPQIKAFASKTLPVLETHQKEAKTLQSQHKGAGGNSAGDESEE